MKNEPLSLFIPNDEPLEITFLVLSGTSILCVASAIDPLRAANRIAGEQLYKWTIVSPDGSNPQTTSGLPVAVSGKFDAGAHHEVLIVIAGFGTAPFTKGPFLAGLRKAGRRARAVGGIEAGTWLLGHAGLLDGRAATTHFEDEEDFRAAFPHSDVRTDRYVIDGPVFTCAGASPTFDLMLRLIRARQGMAMALNVASVFVYDRPRSSSENQTLVSLGQLETQNPRIATAIRLMETNIDAPQPISTIAKRLTITPRTLEIAFQKLIGETPGHYYLNLRLAAARKMVTDTKLPMTEIATRTGFNSAASFSRAFKGKFAITPTSLRS